MYINTFDYCYSIHLIATLDDILEQGKHRVGEPHHRQKRAVRNIHSAAKVNESLGASRHANHRNEQLSDVRPQIIPLVIRERFVNQIVSTVQKFRAVADAESYADNDEVLDHHLKGGVRGCLQLDGAELVQTHGADYV